MKQVFRLLAAVLAVMFYGCTNVPKAEPAQDLHVIQMCDPQLGMANYPDDLDNLRDAVSQINRLNPDVVIVCGDLVNKADEKSYADFKAAVKPLTVPLICVPGNHDIGNRPTLESMALYQKEIGPDHYTADIKGCRVIVVNTMWWKFPADAMAKEQDVWLKAELRKAMAEKMPVIIAGHGPLFVKNANEKEEYFNVGLEKRRELLALFAANNVRLALFGHTHTSFENRVNGLLMINGPTTSINFDQKPLGFNQLIINIRDFSQP